MRIINSVSVLSSLLLFMIMLACSGESQVESAGNDSDSKVSQAEEAKEKKEEGVVEETVQNAAVHYNKAFELLKFPPNNSAERRMTTIMHMGWAKGGGQDFIDSFSFPENEACLAEFRKGLEKDICDFFLGEAKVQLPTGDSYRNKSIWYMTCLHLVRARYYESLGKWKEAFTDGVTALHFTRHIAQNLPFIDKVTANNCELRALITLTDIVKKNNIDRDSLALLAKGLAEHEKKRHSAWRIMEDEKTYFHFVIDRLSQELTDDEGEKIDADIMKSLKRKVLKSADEYYDLAKTAYESDEEQDWMAVEDEHTNALTATLDARDTIRTVSELEGYILRLIKDRGKKGITEVARFLVGYYTSSAKSMWDSHQKNKDMLTALRSRLGPA